MIFVVVSIYGDALVPNFMDEMNENPLIDGSTHDVCRGTIAVYNTSKDFNTLKCAQCGLRNVYPKEVRTLNQLAAHLASSSEQKRTSKAP
jgi:hypothetical protein